MANSRTSAPSVDRNPLLVFPVMDQAYSKHFEDLPFENVVNAVRKVIKHKMSNEVYSATLNSLNDEIGLTKEMSKDDRSEKAKAFRESNADRWREVYLAEADKMWQAGELYSQRARTRYDQQKPKRAFWNSRITAARRVRRPWPPSPVGWGGSGIPG